MHTFGDIIYEEKLIPLVYRLKPDGLKKFEEDEYY